MDRHASLVPPSGSERSSSPSSSDDDRRSNSSGDSREESDDHNSPIDSDDGAPSMTGASLARLPPSLSAAVASVQRRIFPALIAGRQGVVEPPSSDSDSDSEGKCDDYETLVLELAIVEHLIKKRRSSSQDTPILADQRAVISAAVSVYQELQNPQPDSSESVQHEISSDHRQAVQSATQNSYPSRDLPANLLQQREDQQRPQVLIPPSNDIVPSLQGHEETSAIGSNQAQLLTILAGASNLLDPTWVRAQIQRPKRPRDEDNLHDYGT